MRYIGCKRRLLAFIHQFIIDNKIEGKIFCDLFSGTATVGGYFKQQGYQIISSDFLYSSYVQQRVKIAINTMPSFDTLVEFLGINKRRTHSNVDSIIHYLNSLEGEEGFIFKNYSPGGTQHQEMVRMYYTDENAQKIDAIRNAIQEWKNLSLINEDEFCVLLYSLLNEASDYANTTGVFSAFLKKWCRNKSVTLLQLKIPRISPSYHCHSVYCSEALLLLQALNNVDILYLDPPYTSTQYGHAYHLMETLMRWDFPIIKGITGVRNENQKSLFSSRNYALGALEQVVNQRKYRHLLLSYNNEGIISHNDILSLLRKYGTVIVGEVEYKRYSSVPTKKISTKNCTHERLYYLMPSHL